jgi:hypothetical protein
MPGNSVQARTEGRKGGISIARTANRSAFIGRIQGKGCRKREKRVA